MSNSIKKVIFLTMVGGLFFITAENISAQSCQPNDNQIAIFTERNFKGKCKVLEVGEYPNAAAMDFDDDSISSIKVGAFVLAVLDAAAEFTGGENDVRQVFYDDNNFLGDSAIGDNTVSALEVRAVAELQKNMIGTWVQDDQRLIINKNNITVYRSGKLFRDIPYSLIDEDAIEFTSTTNNSSTQRKISFKDSKIMVWTDVSKNTSSEFTRVLKAAKGGKIRK